MNHSATRKIHEAAHERTAGLIVILLSTACSLTACSSSVRSPDGRAAGGSALTGLGGAGALQACADGRAQVQADLLNWSLSDAERAEFFHLSQGSELYPVDWLLALRTQDGRKFFDPTNLGYGLLADGRDPLWNQFGLPVGMTVAKKASLGGIMAFGFNCAGCHVGEVRAEGIAYRIAGAPSTFDIDSFLTDFSVTVAKTMEDPQRLIRFVADLQRDRGHVLPKDVRDSTRTLAAALAAPDTNCVNSSATIALVARVGQIQQEEARAADSAPPASEAEGTSQDVALGGALENALVSGDLPGLRGSTAEEQRTAATQFLTNLRQTLRLYAQTRIKLRLAAGAKLTTTHAGPGRIDAFNSAHNLLFREDEPWELTAPVDYPRLWNVSQFEVYHYDGNTSCIIHRNAGEALGVGASLDTLQIENLVRLEELVSTGIKAPVWPFTAPDPQVVNEGSKIFASECLDCHDHEGGELFDGDTDPNRATSFGRTTDDGTPFHQKLEPTLRKAIEAAKGDFVVDACDGTTPAWWTTGKYLSRTLTGTWATAPYLHNGSVPSLAALLQLTPRPTEFVPGRNDLDLTTVGYCDGAGQAGRVARTTTESGNSNTGHEYGTKLKSDEKHALLAYLKTL